MRKTTAILFLFISLFNIGGFQELFKINLLVAHFYETNKNGPAASFYQFLEMHYITDDLNAKDDERDKQLPFKSAEKYISTSTFICSPDLNMQALAPKFFTICTIDKIITKNRFFDRDYYSFIWHPPKYS